MHQGKTALSPATCLLAAVVWTQLAPRLVVETGSPPIAYRDHQGHVACRTDSVATFCISQHRETLACDAAGCVQGSATEQDWSSLRAEAEPIYVHPHTEIWSGRYDGAGCVAREAGGFDCRSASGAQESIFMGEGTSDD